MCRAWDRKRALPSEAIFNIGACFASTPAGPDSGQRRIFVQVVGIVFGNGRIVEDHCNPQPWRRSSSAVAGAIGELSRPVKPVEGV